MTSAELLSLHTNQTLIRLTKMSAHFKEDNAYLLPTGYWVEGILRAPVTIGETIKILRCRRPRWPDDPEGTPETVEAPGLFESSQIERIVGGDLYTRNSVWKIEEVALIPVAQSTIQPIAP